MFTTVVSLRKIVSRGLIATTVFILVLGTFIENAAKNRQSTSVVVQQIDSSVINKTDHESLRATAYRESGIKVPEGIPYETLKYMFDRCEEKDIPVSIFFRLVYAESGFDSTVTSYAGATGFCGIMPQTFDIWSKRLNISGKTCRNNILISTELLRYLNDKFKHMGERRSWELTLASYNAGIGRVAAAGYNIPDIKETHNYIRIILK